MTLKNCIIFKYFYLFIPIIICLSCVSKTQTKKDVGINEFTSMTFKKELHDFGEIPKGKSVSVIFKFTNTGENPLLIKGVITGCSCTVPEWPKEIIAPHEKGEIKIVYDAKYPGRFNKTITVFYNSKKSPQELTIKGEVPHPEKEEKLTQNKIN